MRPTRTVVMAFLTSATLAGAVVGIVAASPASQVTPTLLARGTFGEFNVQSQMGPHMFKAQAKGTIDVVVRRHDYGAGGSTGWHAHPYPVFVTVISGTVTFYEYGDPTCTPHVVRAGQGYVDSGRGHIGRNETSQPATDISVIMAPVAGAFRSELGAPSPHCGF